MILTVEGGELQTRPSWISNSPCVSQVDRQRGNLHSWQFGNTVSANGGGPGFSRRGASDPHLLNSKTTRKSLNGPPALLTDLPASRHNQFTNPKSIPNGAEALAAVDAGYRRSCARKMILTVEGGELQTRPSWISNSPCVSQVDRQRGNLHSWQFGNTASANWGAGFSLRGASDPHLLSARDCAVVVVRAPGQPARVSTARPHFSPIAPRLAATSSQIRNLSPTERKLWQQLTLATAAPLLGR